MEWSVEEDGLAATLAGAAFGATTAGAGADDFIAAAVRTGGFHVGVADGCIDPFGCFLFIFAIGAQEADGAVDRLFLHGFDLGHGKLGLGMVGGGFFAIAGRNSHPIQRKT